MRYLIVLFLSALAVLVCPNVASFAGKPGPGPVPPGTIYCTGGGYLSMNGDGSNKQPTRRGEPSRLVHGGRWFLEVENVAGTYPNGEPRAELFATRDDGLKVQLTNDPNLQTWATEGQEWAKDDSFASQPMVRWTPVSSGGNFTDGAGQQWLVEAGVYKAALDWTTGSPVAGAPVAVLPAGLRFVALAEYDQFIARSDIWALDWSPSGTQLAYMRQTANPGQTGTYDLYVASFDGAGNVTGTVHLGKGRSPEWAPNGGRIAFQDLNSVIWTVKADGTGLFQLTSPPGSTIDHSPKWSPDSAYIAFGRAKYVRGVPTANVMRVAAGGGSPTDLTSDLDESAGFSPHGGGWR